MQFILFFFIHNLYFFISIYIAKSNYFLNYAELIIALNFIHMYFIDHLSEIILID